MAKNNRSTKQRQAQHKRNGKKSQHDKRKRLENSNPKRKKTSQAKIPLAGAISTAVLALQAVLDKRVAFRFSIMVAGMLLADGRRTASSWFVAAGVNDDWCALGVRWVLGALGATHEWHSPSSGLVAEGTPLGCRLCRAWSM